MAYMPAYRALCIECTFIFSLFGKKLCPVMSYHQKLHRKCESTEVQNSQRNFLMRMQAQIDGRDHDFLKVKPVSSSQSLTLASYM